MKSILTKLCLIIFLLGVISSPGYLIYCSHFSGSAVGEHKLFSFEITPVAIDGITKRTLKGDDASIDPVSFHLDPSMNPVGISIAGNFIRPLHSSNRTKYNVKLSKDKTLIWEKPLFINSGNNTRKKQKKKSSLSDVKIGKMGLDSFSLHVKSFSVPDQGNYKLFIQRIGLANLRVTDMKVKIRKNVTIANKTIVLCGSLALGAGLIGLIIIGIINKKQKQKNS